MARIIISIACFVLAVAISGCHEHELSDSSAEIEHDSIKAPKVNEKKNVVDNAKTQEENDSIVIVYYFHRTMRCPTCLAIEANAARVIEEEFPQQVAEGTLIWIPFNLDESGGKEFEKEFNISVSTLVLSEADDSGNTKYRKLEKVWDYVGDQEKFDFYVKNEVEKFLNE